MCGIVGIVEAPGGSVDESRLASLRDRMTHRGPDDAGAIVRGRAGIAMRRLSIIDLEGGHQPMVNDACPRAGAKLAIVFNGEIYNHAALRAELEAKGHRFQTRSDTEALLHAYEEWGEAFLERLNGMFGIAIWDADRERLLIARDRIGIKPLYYHQDGQRLVFASEIKAIVGDPGVSTGVDRQALFDYIGYEFVPGPHTMFDGVRKLPAGSYAIFEKGELEIRQWWDVTFKRFEGTEAEAETAVVDTIRRSVERRLIADVPIGVFLSGGVDSSSIAAMVRQLTDRPFQTFAIGYDDPSFSELEYARVVSKHLGSDHTEVMIRPLDESDIESAVWHLDEPMTDLSAMPLFLLCQRARQDVKVCLSGEGGDEVFVGYDRFRASRATALWWNRIPRVLRRGMIEPIIRRLPDQEQKKGAINVLKRYVEGAALDPVGEHMRWQHFLPPALAAKLFRPEFRGPLDTSQFRPVAERVARCASSERIDREVYVDLRMTMVDSVLMKVDKMSMAASLEVRVPFLDHELVELATSLPAEWRLRGYETKSILKRAMLPYLPREILYRKKQGYSLPIKNWLRSELRDYARSRIAGCRLLAEVLDPAAVDAIWEEHLSRKQNHNHVLWALLNVALWYDRYFENPAAAA